MSDSSLRGADAGDTATTRPDPTVARKQPRWHSVAIALLKLCMAAYLVSMILQVVLGSLFVTGNVDLLRLHEANANSVLSLTLFIAAPLAVLLWRPLRGPTWPLWWILLLIVLTETQKVIGFLRDVGTHLVLGILVFGLSTVVGYDVLRYRHRPRPRRMKKGGTE